MKTILKLTAITCMLIMSTTSCKQKADEANTTSAAPVAVSKVTAIDYVVNVNESVILWKGFKPTKSHNGTLALTNGSFKLDNDVISSGNFTIDMNSITCTDLSESEGKAKLEGHLKGLAEGTENHFFNVKAFPTASFEVTGSEVKEGKTMLSGNLTIKGNTNNITFPVAVTKTADTIAFTSEAFTIDRTKWSVNYSSKSVFDNLGDSFINDDMEIQITIKAKQS